MDQGGNQDQIGPRSGTSIEDEVKTDMEKGPEEVAAKQNKAQGKEIDIRAKAVASSQQQPNRIVQFGKPDHLISPGFVQKGVSKSSAPGITLAPRWCPPGLTHSQRRRIQWMRAQKLKEDAAEKERDEHFNSIHPMWRVKEKIDTPAPTTSDDDVDLLDNDEASLIKDGSPSLTDMDINMVFTLPTEFRDVEKEVAQMCLRPKEVVFEKPEESSQHMKPLYMRGHIDRRPISRMLIDGGIAINLMPDSIFKKLGREDDELMKTNLTLNDVGATRWRLEALSPWSSLSGASLLLLHSSSSRCKVIIVFIFGHDWIHAKRCIPSTLHQFFIQWIDEVEVVHANASVYIALADATADWQHGSIQCLSGKDLTGYDFLSVSKDEFVPMSVQPASETRLGGVVF
jgi:hypothetical protein